MDDIVVSATRLVALKPIYNQFVPIVQQKLALPPAGDKISDPTAFKDAGKVLKEAAAKHTHLTYSLAEAALDAAHLSRERVSLLLDHRRDIDGLKADDDVEVVLAAIDRSLGDSDALIKTSVMRLASAERYDPLPVTALYTDVKDRQTASRRQQLALLFDKQALTENPHTANLVYPHRHPDDPTLAFRHVTTRLSAGFARVADRSLDLVTHNMDYITQLVDVIRPNVPGDLVPGIDGQITDLLGEGVAARQDADTCLAKAFDSLPAIPVP